MIFFDSFSQLVLFRVFSPHSHEEVPRENIVLGRLSSALVLASALVTLSCV